MCVEFDDQYLQQPRWCDVVDHGCISFFPKADSSTLKCNASQISVIHHHKNLLAFYSKLTKKFHLHMSWSTTALSSLLQPHNH